MKNKYILKNVFLTFLVSALLLPILALPVSAATTVNVLDGQISVTGTLSGGSVTGTSGNTAVSGNVVTVTAGGGRTGQTTNTVSITNNTATAATITFDYTASNYSAFSESSASGTKSLELGPGDEMTVLSITGKKAMTSNTATLTLSNFTYEAAADESEVTFEFANGSVTVAGAKVSSSDKVNIASESGAALVATPNSGYTFLGWLNGDNALISTVSSYTLYPVGDMTVKAAFAGSTNAWFSVVDGTTTYLYNDLNAANIKALSATNKTILLLANGTLPSGDYAISSGVTLLIPYDDNNTLCTTKPTITETNSTPSVYRMLTMARGAHITVNGAISVSGQQYCSRPLGAVSGKYGVIEMAEGSSITVENGGFLYAWGYIAGVTSNKTVSEGTVTIKNGGTVYEDFQVVDWRGGSATSDMINNTNKVFPLSQYYVQNVQVPMTLESGATEKTFTSVKVTLIGIQEAPVTFIGTGGMFVLDDNTSIIKDYDEATDRLILEIVKGSVSLGSVKMTLKISTIGGTKTIDSSKYVLPINNNITIIANNGTTLSASNDIALLPGAKLILEDGAKCNIDGGNFYIYDLNEWSYDPADYTGITASNGKNGGYCSEFNHKMIAVSYAHDRFKTRTTADLEDASVEVNGTITVGDGAYVYTTAGGANIYSTGSGKIEFKGAVGTATQTYQAIATGDDRTGVAYCDIAITAAQLKNGDGSYVSTSSATTATTYTYCPACLAWVCAYGSDGTVNFATNVELANSLNMYFAFWDPKNPEKAFGDWDSYSVEISHKDKDGNLANSITLSYDLWYNTTVDGANACVVYYKGLSAKQMGDVIKVTLKNGSGDVVHEWSDSIQSYAMRLLKKYEDDEKKGNLRTLIVDMLNYGATCQKYFAEQAGETIADEDLVNAGLSTEQKSWATETINWSTDMPSGSDDHKGNLIVDGNIQFAISNADDQTNYTFTNHWNTATSQRSGYLLYNTEGNYFYISKLYVADARQVITITVNGTIFTDSVEAYCYRMKDTNEVFTAFMKFSDAAKAYLHDKEGRVE